MRITLLFLGLSGLTGCFGLGVGKVTEDNFAEKAAKSKCKQLKACDPITFYADPDDLGAFDDDLYPEGDMADCLDEWTDFYEDLQEFYDDENCDFDEDKANECFNVGTCKNYAENLEDVNDACSEVFDC